MRQRCSLLTIACACAIATLAGESPQAAGAHHPANNLGSSQPGIAVLVYNYAAVSASTMSRACERVNRLYREAGVEV